MKDHNTITIVETDGTSYTEKVGWSFDEAAKALLGKQGKNGSPIYSVSVDGHSSRMGFPFKTTQVSI